MNEQSSRCKGCRASVRVSEESVRKILSDLMKDESLTLAPEEVWIARMERCRQCEHLEYGTTCRYCGCLVAVRTRILNKDCPEPGGGRW